VFSVFSRSGDPMRRGVGGGDCRRRPWDILERSSGGEGRDTGRSWGDGKGGGGDWGRM
jgi:hypothetical protein